ncbi:MAG: EAL domain-containing protein [Spongiibacteraceae bacterium]
MGAPVLPAAALLEKAAAASIAYMHTDLAGRVLERNAFLTELFGEFDVWSPEVWLRCFHPDEIPQLIRNARNAVQQQSADVLGDAARVRDGSGGWCWVSTSSMLQRDQHGVPQSWFSFFVRLPSLGLLEERFRAASLYGDIRYRALFDHSSDATLLVNNHRVVECNEAAATLFGVKRQQLLGMVSTALISPVQRSGEDVENHLARLRALIETGHAACWESTGHRLDNHGLFEVEVTVVRINLEGDVFELATLRDITHRIEAERQLAHSNRELALRNQNLAWLQESCALIYEQPDLEALAQIVVRCLQAHYSAPHVYFILTEAEGHRVMATSQPTAVVGQIRPRSRVLDRALVGTEKVLVVRDFERELNDAPQYLQELRQRGTQLCVFMMLMDGDREVGLLVLEYSDAASFDTADLDGLELFARTLAMAVVKTRSLAALEYQARHDALTGLHNRSVLHGEFQRWQTESNAPAMLFLLDLNRFKEINDTLGHHVGDDLLRQIGGRLRNGLAYRRAILCRLGGDEFAVLVQNPSVDAELAIGVAHELLAAIRQPFLVNGVHLEISGSIGVALYPQHGNDSHALLRFADVAMYEAKHSGAGALVYDNRLDLHSPERLRVIVDLNSGIRERELLLHYQPKLNLRTGEIVGCEALVRWQHPQRGLIPPDEFLPLAEVGDTIHALTAFVIEEAVAQQRAWLMQGINLQISVNLSARNLIDDRVYKQLERLILQHELPPGTLELEITETALMHDPNRAIALLKRIASLGVGLSIDDFGTGYSSLAYLRRLPIDTLKIDRSFIGDMLVKPQDAVIVQSIVTLGHNLDLSVVAEGVESAAVLDGLEVMGCDQIQGFYLSKPMPAAQMPDWLATYAASVGA